MAIKRSGFWCAKRYQWNGFSVRKVVATEGVSGAESHDHQRGFRDRRVVINGWGFQSGSRCQQMGSDADSGVDRGGFRSREWCRKRGSPELYRVVCRSGERCQQWGFPERSQGVLQNGKRCRWHFRREERYQQRRLRSIVEGVFGVAARLVSERTAEPQRVVRSGAEDGFCAANGVDRGWCGGVVTEGFSGAGQKRATVNGLGRSGFGAESNGEGRLAVSETVSRGRGKAMENDYRCRTGGGVEGIFGSGVKSCVEGVSEAVSESEGEGLSRALLR